MAAIPGWAGHLTRKTEPRPGEAAVQWRDADEEHGGRQPRTNLEAPKEKLGARLRKRCGQGLSPRQETAAKTGRTKDERLLAKLYAAKGGPANKNGRLHRRRSGLLLLVDGFVAAFVNPEQYRASCLRPFKYRPKASGDLAWAL